MTSLKNSLNKKSMKRATIVLVACAFMSCTNAAKVKNDAPVEAETPSDQTAKEQITYEDGVLTLNGLRYELALVEAGTFTMGAAPEVQKPSSFETPAHQVTLTKNYLIGKTVVTQAQWAAIMGENPAYFEGDNFPMRDVSWDDCQSFIDKINAATGKNFRLPTEAEWEFAARGGNKSKHFLYSGSNDINAVAWYLDNNRDALSEVAKKQPNELGLYDMSGNILEWCYDWYADYSDKPQTDPTGPETGPERVTRGGTYYWEEEYCRPSMRQKLEPDQGGGIGLRLALTE